MGPGRTSPPPPPPPWSVLWIFRLFQVYCSSPVNYQNAINYISFSRILKTSCDLRNFLPNVFTSGLIVIPCIWYLIRFTDSKLELPVHSLHSSSIIGQGFCKKEDYFDVYNTLLQHTTLFQWRWNYINFQNWKITSLMRLKRSKND